MTRSDAHRVTIDIPAVTWFRIGGAAEREGVPIGALLVDAVKRRLAKHDADEAFEVWVADLEVSPTRLVAIESERFVPGVAERRRRRYDEQTEWYRGAMRAAGERRTAA